MADLRLLPSDGCGRPTRTCHPASTYAQSEGATRSSVHDRAGGRLAHGTGPTGNRPSNRRARLNLSILARGGRLRRAKAAQAFTTGSNPNGYRLSHTGFRLKIPDGSMAGGACQAMPARSVREKEMAVRATVTTGVTINHPSLDKTRDKTGPLPSAAEGQTCIRRMRTQ